MKKSIQLSVLCLILSLCLMSSVTYGAVNKTIRIGKYWDIVNDNCQQATPEGGFGQYYHDNQGRSGSWSWTTHRTTGTYLACKDWTDPATSTTYEYWIGGGAGHVGPNKIDNFMPIEDDEGYTIKKYWRYNPPLVVVDDRRSSDPMRDGDEVNGAYIPGTADVMIESSANTMLGITIHQRVYGWSQQNHDDYHIYDWTLTNTGNLDLDDEIETTQTIKDFYIMRGPQITNSWHAYHLWPSRTGELIGDTLRASYVYPARQHNWTIDLLGDVSTRGSNAGWM